MRTKPAKMMPPKSLREATQHALIVVAVAVAGVAEAFEVAAAAFASAALEGASVRRLRRLSAAARGQLFAAAETEPAGAV